MKLLLLKFTIFTKYKKVHSFIWVSFNGYFINHKTKDYFYEGAGWVIKSVNEYFKGIKEPWFATTIFGWYTLQSRRLS